MLKAKPTTVYPAVFIALCILLLTARPSLSWDSLIGHESCEFVVSQLAAEDESVTLIVAAFITGVNYAAGRTLEADVHELVIWVNEFCHQNPSARFLDALIALDEKLEEDLKVWQTPAEEEGPKTPETTPPGEETAVPAPLAT